MPYIEYSNTPLDSKRWSKKKFFAFCSIPLSLQVILFYSVSFLTQDFSLFDSKADASVAILGKIGGALMVCLACHYGIIRLILWGVNFRLYDTSAAHSVLIPWLEKFSIISFVLFCIFTNVIWYVSATMLILIIVIYATCIPSDKDVNLYGVRVKNTFMIEFFAIIALFCIALNIKFIAGLLFR